MISLLLVLLAAEGRGSDLLAMKGALVDLPSVMDDDERDLRTPGRSFETEDCFS